jgi:predicted transcriptional regulator
METAVIRSTGVKKKVDALFALQKITLKDIENLDIGERKYLSEAVNDRMQHLKGEERDNFINKIEIICTNTNTDVWEYNHQMVTYAITRLMNERGYMPSVNNIAEETGLSRQTVSKHLKEYRTNPEYIAQLERFKYMAPKIIAGVFKLATRGDVKAARLYLETVGATHKKQSNTVVNEQNNYIQINNTILSQENLKALSAEQLNMIEGIIKGQLKIS